MKILRSLVRSGSFILIIFYLAQCTSAKPGSSPSFTIGGTITGLSGTLVLQDKGGDNLSLSSSGSFTFATPVVLGGSYAVTVLTQPNGLLCTVANGSGTVGPNDVTGVTVTCSSTTYTIGGSVTGLTGTLVLQDNLGGSYTASSNGAFTLSSNVATGTTYYISVMTQPANQYCAVTNGFSSVTNASINVTVTCAAVKKTIFVTIATPQGNLEGSFANGIVGADRLIA